MKKIPLRVQRALKARPHSAKVRPAHYISRLKIVVLTIRL